MWAGYNLVETHAPAADGQRLQLIYMDDRSFTAHTPHTLINTLDQWHHFSTQIGLQENRSKTKLTTASTPQRRQLQAFRIDRPELQQCITQSACILGTYTTTNTVHGLQPKERERLATAKAVLKRIQYFPVDHQTKMQTAQLMATSKAAYGWIGKAPEVKNFNSAIRQCSTAFKQGALGLQLMLGGAHLALDAVVGRRQVLLWCKRQTSEQWSRQTQAAGHLAIAARDFLIQDGWSQTNHQQWHHWSLGVTFRSAEATTTEGYHKIAHQIRESWREQQWLLFEQAKDMTP